MCKVVFPILMLAPMMAMSQPTAPPTRMMDTSTMLVVDIPTQGKVSTARVGDAIYHQGIIRRNIQYKVSLTAATESELDGTRKLSTPKDVVLSPKIRGDGKEVLACFPVKKSGLFAGARVFGCLVDSDGDRVFDNATYEHRTIYYPITNSVPYEISRNITDYPNEDAFKFDILYQGISRGEIKISYREYINNMARASFNQDVTYELNRTGPTDISFKGVRMKIIRADNHEVEYVVDQAAGTSLRDGIEPVPKASDEKPWYQGGKE